MPLLLFEQSAGEGVDQPSLVVTLLSPEDEQIENPISFYENLGDRKSVV